MRLYFHLADNKSCIIDGDGVEVFNLELARDASLSVFEEIYDGDDPGFGEWIGWTLTIADSAGAVLLTLDLGSPVEELRWSEPGIQRH